jgi:DNA-binding transcriptional regulator YbjK
MYNFDYRAVMGTRDQRKYDLLDATLRIIAAGGVDAVRARRVATEAGAPLGSVSYWFEGREALIRGAFVHFLEANTGFLEAILAMQPVECPEDLVNLLVQMVQLEFMDRSRVLAEYELLLAAARDPVLAETLARWEATVLDVLAGLFDALGGETPRASARTLLEYVRGYELRALAQSEPDLADLRIRLTTLIHGLLAPQRNHP